ncbi:MAG: hypothetical protein RLZZ96_1883 [Bacteroidota bacterium]|jgi:hypothetical protein
MSTDSSIQELQKHRDKNQVNLGVKLEKRIEFNSIEQLHNLELRLLEKFTKLEIQLIEAKSELFQWMCFFWVTQTAANVVMILLLLKK